MLPQSPQQTRILLFLILIFTVLCFLPSLENTFVTWDDDVLLTENSLIKKLTFDNLKQIFTKPIAANYHPLTLVTWTLEHSLFGLDLFFYHFNNLLLHLINIVLVFTFFRILTKNNSLSLIICLFFAIHPTRVEAVAWLSSRKDVLYGFFYLSSCISYLYYKKERNTSLLLFSILFFLFSLLSKPLAITLPFLLLFFDYHVSGKITQKDIINKTVFFILSLIFAWICYAGHEPYKQVSTYFNSPFFFNIMFGWHAFFKYLHILFLPFNLSPFYAYPSYHTFFWISQYITVPISLGIGAVFFFLMHRLSKKILFSVIFFLITAAPILKIFPMGGTIAADRFTYLPALGFFYLFAHGILFLYHRVKERPFRLVVFGVFFMGIIVFLGLKTWRQNFIWKNSYTLWTEVISTNPNLFIAHFYLGDYYYEVKNYEAASRYFKKGTILSPYSSKTFFRLGASLLHQGKEKEGLDAFSRALDLNANFLPVNYFRGGYFYKKRDYKKAIPDFEKILSLDPADEEIKELLQESRDKA